ncbi:MAG: threonylcarbamoyl-AMP synthase [Bacteroidales bacterium]|nr:threonylcarbamoyl-AMP synthase [Bacteroidales bacterium]
MILYPTDTVWGIGCDATNPEAVAKVYEIKKRPDSKSLVLLAANLDQIARYIKQIPDMAIDLVEVNDAPMTIIYPGADTNLLAPNAVAEDGTVGIRIPMMEFCQKVCQKLGRPIVSTSANVSGEPAAKVYNEIVPEIRDAVDYIVDPSLEAGSTGQASQIIKVGLDGEIKIIRQ